MSATDDDGGRTNHRRHFRPVSRRNAWILIGTGLLLFAATSVLVSAGATGWDGRMYRALNEVPSQVAAVLTPLSKLFLPVGITVAIATAAIFCVVRIRRDRK